MKHAFLSLFTIFTISLPLQAQVATKTEPRFPSAPPGLIYLEGEDALSTNFAREATLDYSSSAYRILRLNREGQATDLPFYTEYSFYTEEAGSWRLFLGGSLPGPRNELESSYTSPLSIRIDEGQPIPLAREEVTRIEKYATNAEWYTAKNVFELSAGSHILRIEITDRRRYDNRYFFSLDALFFLNSTSPLFAVDADRTGLPAHFPQNLAARIEEGPEYSINDYEWRIQNDPKNKEDYLALAQIYSLVGDSSNAVKTLARGRLLAGEDTRFLLQSAKNRIWSGDSNGGLQQYREYLVGSQSQSTEWAEAAKISAWLSKYPESLALYRDALARFPNDLNLIVNYGLTYLWAGRGAEGEAQLERAEKKALASLEGVKELASIFQVNGYPDKQRLTLERGLQKYPNELELYLLAIKAAYKADDEERSSKLEQDIQDRFVESAELDAVLGSIAQDRDREQRALTRYQDRLEAEPDNLDLRRELVRALYWNGRLEDAVTESNRIIVNKLYRILDELDADLGETWRILQAIDVYRNQAEVNGKQAKDAAASLRKANEAWKKTKDGLPLAIGLEKAELIRQKQAEHSSNLAALIEEANLEGNLQKDDSATLATLKPWKWHKDSDLVLLEMLAASGDTLAQSVLDSLDRIAGKVKTATLENPTPVTDEMNSENVQPLFTEDTPETALNTASLLEKEANALPNLLSTLKGLQERLYKRADTRLQVRMYQFDIDSIDERRDLADTFLKLEKPMEAGVELERLLKVAPSDMYALFTLGRAREIAGNWSGAMDAYGQVYEIDPRFENSASAYNKLARVHADQLSTSVSTYISKTRTATQAVLEYEAAPSSKINLNAAYTLDTLRIHSALPPSIPATAELHSLDAKASYNIAPWNLSVSGLLGGTLKNKLWGESSTYDSAFDPSDLGDFIAVAPRLGLGAQWQYKPFTLDARWKYEQIKDSFLPGRDSFYQHEEAASISATFDFPSTSRFQTAFVRTHGTLAQVSSPFNPETNQLYTALAEFNVDYLFATAPRSILSLGANAIFEDSTHPEATDYYAPNAVKTAKGGIRLTTKLAQDKSWNINLSGRVWGGIWMDSVDSYPSWEAAARVELTKGDLQFFMDTSFSRTGDTTTGTYWEARASLGASILMPDYLIK